MYLLNQGLQSDIVCTSILQIIRLHSIYSVLHLNIFRLLIFGAYTYENNNENSSFIVALKEHNLTHFCHYFYWNSLTSVLINIQDATPLINDLYYPLVSSTFFGQSLAHHQEHPLMNCTKYWYVRAIRLV